MAGDQIDKGLVRIAGIGQDRHGSTANGRNGRAGGQPCGDD